MDPELVWGRVNYAFLVVCACNLGRNTYLLNAMPLWRAMQGRSLKISTKPSHRRRRPVGHRPGFYHYPTFRYIHSGNGGLGQVTFTFNISEILYSSERRWSVNATEVLAPLTFL